ncbi:MAG: hypothetical protein ROW39_07800, partial [Anaerolineaceae bacterium]
ISGAVENVSGNNWRAEARVFIHTSDHTPLTSAVTVNGRWVWRDGGIDRTRDDNCTTASGSWDNCQVISPNNQFNPKRFVITGLSSASLPYAPADNHFIEIEIFRNGTSIKR